MIKGTENYVNNILEVKDLCLNFEGDPQDQFVLNGVSFNIRQGEILGLIGNSGCGKSMTALSITGLLPASARIRKGSITLSGTELLSLDAKKMRHIRGKKIGMIFQEPMTALDPLMTIFKNLEEVITEHEDIEKNERKVMITDMLKRVGFDNAEEILSRYPHELSGGQRQRVLIAGACLLKPDLMIADEPTSSLDTVTSVSILELIRSLCSEYRMSVLFISHDLSVVGSICDRILVMKQGTIIDRGNTFDIIYNPRNPYTAELLSRSRLDPKDLGLKFNKPSYSSEPALKVTGLCAGYTSGKMLKRKKVDIIHDIGFKILPGEVVGLIGGSGCGKTTLTRALCGLIRPTAGKIENYKGKIGVVFQDPASCLNPSYKVSWHLMEPLKANKIKTDPVKFRKEAISVLNSVGLEEKHLDRYPSQLSGGQKQRVAIAMCLILDPSIIIADEPLSSLDTTSGARILTLLSEINMKRKTSILLISHNLRVIRSSTSYVLVMENGKIVEDGPTANVLSSPQSEAAKKLLEAETGLHRNSDRQQYFE